MRTRYRILEYLSITGFTWGIYLVWLIPFQLGVVGLDWNQFIKWLWIGTIAEMLVAYPITKTLVKYVPKISAFYQRLK